VSEPRSSERSEDQAAGQSTGRSAGQPSHDDPLGDIRQRISELIDYFFYYISARIDTLKFAVKRRIFIASWIAIAVLAGAGAIITAVALLCEGVCDGLSVLFGHRWAGELATGAMLILVVAGGGYGAIWYLIRRSHLKSMAKYEAMRRKEREQFGRDATEPTGNGDRHG
jgi:hypothetical protein